MFIIKPLIDAAAAIMPAYFQTYYIGMGDNQELHWCFEVIIKL